MVNSLSHVTRRLAEALKPVMIADKIIALRRRYFLRAQITVPGSFVDLPLSDGSCNTKALSLDDSNDTQVNCANIGRDTLVLARL